MTEPKPISLKDTPKNLRECFQLYAEMYAQSWMRSVNHIQDSFDTPTKLIESLKATTRLHLESLTNEFLEKVKSLKEKQ